MAIFNYFKKLLLGRRNQDKSARIKDAVRLGVKEYEETFRKLAQT